MNRYPLNARTLGAGVTVPQVYFSSALNLIVQNTQAVFIDYRGILVSSSVNIRVSSTISLIRAAAISASTVVQMVPTAAVNRVQHLVSAVTNEVHAHFSASVGLAKLIASSISFGVLGVVNATRTAVMTAAQVIEETTSAVFGKHLLWTANQNVVETATTNFTSFGEYAPSERYIIVDSEDRDTEVS